MKPGLLGGWSGGANWFQASGFTLSFPAEPATFPMHDGNAGTEGLLAVLARGGWRRRLPAALTGGRGRRAWRDPGLGHEKAGAAATKL